MHNRSEIDTRSGGLLSYLLTMQDCIEDGNAAIVRLMPLAEKISRHLAAEYYIDYADRGDLLQSVYTGLVEAVRRDDGRGAVDGIAIKWMYGSGREHIYRSRRFYGAGVSNSVTHVDIDFDIPDYRNPERDYAVKQILERLDADTRSAAAMRMIYADGLSYVEAANKIGMSEGGMYKMLARVKRAHK